MLNTIKEKIKYIKLTTDIKQLKQSKDIYKFILSDRIQIIVEDELGKGVLCKIDHDNKVIYIKKDIRFDLYTLLFSYNVLTESIDDITSLLEKDIQDKESYINEQHVFAWYILSKLELYKDIPKVIKNKLISLSYISKASIVKVNNKNGNKKNKNKVATKSKSKNRLPHERPIIKTDHYKMRVLERGVDIDDKVIRNYIKKWNLKEGSHVIKHMGDSVPIVIEKKKIVVKTIWNKVIKRTHKRDNKIKRKPKQFKRY